MQTIPIRNIEISIAKNNFVENFNIRSITSILNGKDIEQETHRHSFYFVLVLEKGKGEHIIDFQPFPVNNNSIFILRPSQVHSLNLKKDSKGYLMSFQPDFFAVSYKQTDQLLRKVSRINHYDLNEKNFSKISNSLHKIFEEFNHQQEAYQKVIKAHLEILFIELCRNKTIDTVNKPLLYKQERLDEFLQLLETKIDKHKQVSKYAELLNLSTYQLNSITKTLLGKSCSKLINEQIILEAKRQLLATSNQVNQIAFCLGYEDSSYFNRFFKNQTNYSPENFRKNFK
jgi:AraC-like DNA-binding protein